ncbi:hypothetical protein SDC9_18817 [bioreactor metagenome]|uniref:Uncharacterized protein n=1 Tax=bioreactor metagenome TaxID=1076179 RepID=A0A644U1B5_9ZZZZ
MIGRGKSGDLLPVSARGCGQPALLREDRLDHLEIAGVDAVEEGAGIGGDFDRRLARGVDRHPERRGGLGPDKGAHRGVQRAELDRVGVADRPQVVALRDQVRVGAGCREQREALEARGLLVHHLAVATDQVLGVFAVEDLVAIEADQPLLGVAPDEDPRVIAAEGAGAQPTRRPDRDIGSKSHRGLEGAAAILADIGIEDPLAADLEGVMAAPGPERQAVIETGEVVWGHHGLRIVATRS